MHPFAYRSFILRFSVRLIPYRIKTAYEPVQVKALAIMALRPSIDCTGHVQPPCGHHPNCNLHPPPPQCQQRHHPISNRRPDERSHFPPRTARPTQDTTSKTVFQRQSLELPHILKRHVVPRRKKISDRGLTPVNNLRRRAFNIQDDIHATRPVGVHRQRASLAFIRIKFEYEILFHCGTSVPQTHSFRQPQTNLDYPQPAKRLARRPRAELARRCLSSLVSPHCGISEHGYCSASSSWHGSSGSSSGPSRPFHLPWRANSRQTPSAMA